MIRWYLSSQLLFIFISYVIHKHAEEIYKKKKCFISITITYMIHKLIFIRMYKFENKLCNFYVLNLSIKYI